MRAYLRGLLDTNDVRGASNASRGLPMDLNVSAFRIVQKLTTETKDDKRSLAARAGGKAGGPARARKLTAVERKAIAVKANRARWRSTGGA